MKKHHELLDDLSLSSVFHENTKRHQLEEEKDTPAHMQRGVQYKTYPRFEKIALLKNFPPESISIQEVIRKYRSLTTLNKMSLSLEAISRILLHSAGITSQDKEDRNIERVYPSVTSIYPLEVYPIILASKEITPGIYHYNVKSHVLESFAHGDFTSQVIRSTKKMKLIKNASAVILISAIFQRSEMMYGDRGYRYVLLNAGHLAQNIVLNATSIDLGSHIISEFLDDELNRLVDLDGVKESIIHIVVLGGLKRQLTQKIRGLFRS